VSPIEFVVENGNRAKNLAIGVERGVIVVLSEESNTTDRTWRILPFGVTGIETSGRMSHVPDPVNLLNRER
jgi:hypothetical protein